MHLSTKELNALGQITQRGWGTSSMPNAVTCTMNGHTLTLKYMTVVHFAAESALRLQAERVSYESIDILTKCVANIKERFKDLTDSSISFKEIANTDSLEVIQSTNNSARRVAYYRRQVTLQVV